jgi:type VI secretion system protein ImpB
MAKEGSVAPQERVNITYKPSTGNQQDEVELPLKMLFIGDYTGRADPRPLEERAPVNVDKDNFQQVLAEQNLNLAAQVPDVLSGEKGAELSVNLKFKKLSDFGPDAVAEQVPELKKLLDLRQAITALKGPLGNIPAFKRKISSLLADDKAREKLVNELGLGVPKEEG